MQYEHNVMLKGYIILYFIADTVLMKLCPCGRYTQLNSVLYPNNHIRKSSQIIFNRLVLKYF